MDKMQEKLLEQAIRMGISLTPVPAPQPTISISKAVPAPPTQTVIETVAAPVQAEVTSPAPVSGPVPVVDPPLMKAEWEKEIDDVIKSHGGRLDIVLQSGAVIRVVAAPSASTDALEIGYDTFKRLSRAATILNGRVVDAMTKSQADTRTRDMLEQGLGCWITEHIFVEVDKMPQPLSGGKSDFGVIAAPTFPPSAPAIVPHQWLSLSGGSIVEQVPMRMSNGKVMGTLIKTQNGAIFARTVKDTDHKLSIAADWSLGGGYTIERELYDKYLTDPTTIIKFIRGERIYLTNSAWIQKYGGIIRHWGTERVVMPLTGSFWLVVDKNGEIIR